MCYHHSDHLWTHSMQAKKVPQSNLESGRLQSMGSQRVRHDWITITCTQITIFEAEVSGYSSVAKAIAKQSSASIPSKYADRKPLILKEATEIYYNNISNHTTYQCDFYQPCRYSNSLFIWNMHLTKHCCCCCQVASVVSDSVWPYGVQPTRLLHPWDFLGNSIGVGWQNIIYG